MSSGENMYHEDWDLQRERLSAYLDNEVDAAEREPLERHLAQCEDCRAALAELRQTRSLLRALPQPTLPRSFTLPIEAAANVRPIADAPSQVARARARTATLARLAQRIGGLAAAVGIVLLLGSWITGIHGPSVTTTASRASQSGAAQQNTQLTTAAGSPTHTPPNFASSTRASGSVANSTENPQTTRASATATAGSSVTQPASRSPASSAPVVPLTGAGLLFGGIALVVAGKTTQTRRARRTRGYL